jgi:hypothetical protein
MEGLTNTVFGRWELAVADNAYIRNGCGNNIREISKKFIASLITLA